MGSSTARALPGKLRAARGDPKGGEARHAAAGPSRVVSCDTSGIMWGLGLGRAGPSPRGHATSVLRGVSRGAVPVLGSEEAFHALL